MRQQNKPRSRNKNNGNRRSMGNAVNRVFDSSGPEGKVRGTPQQIIEKYMSLFRDSQLSGDRVAAENFQQHAEHYTRILSEALKEQNDRKEQQEAQAASRRIERAETASDLPKNGHDDGQENLSENNSRRPSEENEEVAKKEI
jgi:hypothetical protein